MVKIIKRSYKKPDDPIFKEGFKTLTPNKHHKETEYYVVDKVTGKKHRMYLEDEYDLTAPRKKK